MILHKAIHCCASYILLVNRLGLGINFVQWIPLRLYNDTQFVAVALFVATPECHNKYNKS